METTYNQVITKIEKFANNHLQINQFINDHPLAVNQSEDVHFPAFALYPASSSIDRNKMTLNIKAFFIDILDNDKSNERDVLSDTLQIGNDFIQYFARNEDEWGFYIDETTVSMEPFSENFESNEDTNIEDNVAGWYFDVNIVIGNVMNNCNLPFDIPEAKPKIVKELVLNAERIGFSRDAGFKDGYGSIIPDNGEIIEMYAYNGIRLHLKMVDSEGNPVEMIDKFERDNDEFTEFYYEDSYIKSVANHLGFFESGENYNIKITY